ncbi:YopR family T3SS polymerization control protein [Photorhabdus temperata]|uniref:YopR family T3SS polymerization control protein n=1 Tax=Photorhabdus temperata TaxID=574560 RepID=UPI00038A22CD|nr:YopR family T3SS polymerization control protein [Photorhabdus temperata]EQC01036.1 type iii secretion component protein scth [Photorhabdus temperata subsp. temperata M1021]
MNRIEGPSYNIPSQPTAQPSVSVAHKHDFEQALELMPDQQTLKERQQRWIRGESLEEVLGDFDPATQRKIAWQWYQTLSTDSQPSQRAQLEGKLIAPVQEHLWSQFGGLTLPVKPQLDLPEFRAVVREFAPTGRQQETVLLKVLGEIKSLDGNEYLSDLIRRELQTLIPRNGMVDNLIRNSHKLDLEE